MEKLKKKRKIIQKEDGGILLWGLGGLLLLIILLLFVMEIIRIRATVVQIRDEAEKSVEISISANWDKLYTGVREGYAGTFQYEELSGSWKKIFWPADYKKYVYKDLGLDSLGRKKAENKIGYLYQVKNIKIDTIEVDFKQKGQTLNAKGVVEIEMVFLNRSYPLTIPISAKYQKLF